MGVETVEPGVGAPMWAEAVGRVACNWSGRVESSVWVPMWAELEEPGVGVASGVGAVGRRVARMALIWGVGLTGSESMMFVMRLTSCSVQGLVMVWRSFSRRARWMAAVSVRPRMVLAPMRRAWSFA